MSKVFKVGDILWHEDLMMNGYSKFTIDRISKTSYICAFGSKVNKKTMIGDNGDKYLAKLSPKFERIYDCDMNFIKIEDFLSENSQNLPILMKIMDVINSYKDK